eukprot:CAMPEP_0195521916 /NCGR_PEP_ID=MMETSP0794_2-20130614/19680_1 /TAXON_ID=515487 /ORGANISM="Stephanopyxis turris, Strain CCMP 815" /LENGTH=110 /DNA_ID=CAMNT_0040651569 /DNA_START=48 /DNA_END=380 /DNA_ORIENTATION=+
MMSRVLSAARTVARPVSRVQARFFSAGFLDANEVAERVQNVVKNFEKVDAAAVTPSAHFTNDLGLDSLDTVEVVMAIEEEFTIEIPDDQADKLLSISDAVEFIAAHPQAK